MECKEEIVSEDYEDFIIEYNGNREALEELYSDYVINYVNGRYAILYYPRTDNYMEVFSRLEYSLFPKLYGLLEDSSSMSETGVISVQQENILDLRGNGTLVGIVDTGIDIFNPLFKNGDVTRIASAWDQSVSCQGETTFGFGREYTQEEINQAINNNQSILADEEGHGTFMASIAAGSTQEDFTGAAPDSELVVVKLKNAKENIISLYGFSNGAPAFQENDIMMGVSYLIQTSKRLRKPISILIGLGTNSGNHSGYGALASFLNSESLLRGVAISCAGGNEGIAAHHFSGEVPRGENAYETMEINVNTRDNFLLEIWGKAPSIYSVSIEIPGGEFIERIPPRFDKSEKITPLFGGGEVYVDYFLVEEESGDELILFRFIKPITGLWRFRIYASGETDRTFNAWLPISPFVAEGTVFTRPDPENTLVAPSNALNVMCVCAYDHYNDAIYIEGSRGYTYNGRTKPDFCAPGVNVFGAGFDNSFTRKSGTSVAAAHCCGCAALMLEWSQNNNFLYPVNGNQIKQYFIRGAVNVGQSPNNEWGYGKLNLFNTFSVLRG